MLELLEHIYVSQFVQSQLTYLASQFSPDMARHLAASYGTWV
jgi:hypothetical protein